MELDRPELLERERDLALLPLQLLDAGTAFQQRRAQLLDMVRVDVIEIEQLLDVGQREAQALSAQDELEPYPVAMAVDAIAADASRRQQAVILIKADGAMRDRELAREVADRIKAGGGGRAGRQDEHHMPYR